jgi:hypothetical protein
MHRTCGGLAGARCVSLVSRPPIRDPPLVRTAILLVLIAACSAGRQGPTTESQRVRLTTGTIAGLARDHESGDPVARAEIIVRGQGDFTGTRTTTNEHGLYDVGALRPGKYQLSALFAGQPVEVVNIVVRAKETTYVDVMFTLGRPDPLRVDYGDPRQSAIERYKPTRISANVSVIEGTVNDVVTRERVPGAVVTAVTWDTGVERTEQTVSDDHGRFRFELYPGTYQVSAYYSISGRGQVEVRRSDIQVAGAEAVIVPLWVETVR